MNLRIVLGCRSKLMKHARLMPDGTPDSAFIGNGVLLVSDFQGSYPYHVVVSNNGKLLFAGTSCDPTYNFSMLVMRFNEDGSRDTTLGQSGIVRMDLSSGDDMAYGITELSDGRLIRPVRIASGRDF